jgi:hypothetical protein
MSERGLRVGALTIRSLEVSADTKGKAVDGQHFGS